MYYRLKHTRDGYTLDDSPTDDIQAMHVKGGQRFMWIYLTRNGKQENHKIGAIQDKDGVLWISDATYIQINGN